MPKTKIKRLDYSLDTNGFIVKKEIKETTEHFKIKKPLFSQNGKPPRQQYIYTTPRCHYKTNDILKAADHV